MDKVLLINGPNLNLLGEREPEIYGHTTLPEIENNLRKIFETKAIELICFQSNHEGDIVDFLQQNKTAKYAIINAGAYSHTSIAICDAFEATQIPYIELHISNIYAREEFRHRSMLSAKARGLIAGLGVEGYESAAWFILRKL